VLDVDTTDVALHCKQEGSFFHGYNDHYCYLPLYVFSGEHLLCVGLQPTNIDGSAGSFSEIRRMSSKFGSAGADADHLARRLGLLSRRVDDLV
jgi:hypothetical protein